MTSDRSATAARSCNRAVRVAGGGIAEQKCVATPAEAGPKNGMISRFWRNQIRLLTALVFLLSGLAAMAGEAFAESDGCKAIVADLNGKDVGYFSKTYDRNLFLPTDRLHIDLIRNPLYWENAYFNVISGSGTDYFMTSYEGGVVTGNESASISGQDLVSGGIYVEYVNYSQTSSPWRMDVVCVTQSNPADSLLSDLVLSSGALDPAFGTNVFSYTAAVANSVSTLALTPTTVGATATVAINGAPAISGSASSVPLNVGSNSSRSPSRPRTAGSRENITSSSRVPHRLPRSPSSRHR